MSEYINETGARLAALRKEKGLTLKEVSERLGVHETTVNAWEVGKKKKSYKEGEKTRNEKEPYDISSSRLTALADLYGVSCDYILGRTPFRSINGADVARITGLSDSAIRFLSDNMGVNYITAAESVSQLINDYEKHGSESVLALLYLYLGALQDTCISINTGRPAPAAFGHEVPLSGALLYSLIGSIERYKNEYQIKPNA